VTDIYRDAPVFRELRDPSLLHGRCGVCEFNELCGGSRARSYAMTDDYLAEEPFCAYGQTTSGVEIELAGPEGAEPAA
jgi:MoaA/NifB/PqqE/SkfB family radical SAM enzyme